MGPGNLSLRQDVSLKGAVQSAPRPGSANPCEIVDTICQEKGDDAPRTVHERIMNGPTDEDVEEPALCSQHRGHERNISPSRKAVLLFSKSSLAGGLAVMQNVC